MSQDMSASVPTVEEPAKSSDVTVVGGVINQNINLPSEELFNWRKPKSLQLAMQLGLSISVVMFCGIQIILHDMRDKDVSLYWGGVVGILAWWMPSPNAGNSPKTDPK
jgi:hypothetical protein